MDPKRIVAQGYDHIAEYHSQWASRTRAEERQRYTTFVLEQLPPRAPILELGCGAGVPTTLALSRRFQVTGIDLSAHHKALINFLHEKASPRHASQEEAHPT